MSPRYYVKLPWSYNQLNGLAVKRQRLRSHLYNLVVILLRDGRGIKTYRQAQDIE